MSSERLTQYLAENPRMLGVAFMITVLLAQTGSAAGCCCTEAWCGP
jgi:hypothetical protein